MGWLMLPSISTTESRGAERWRSCINTWFREAGSGGRNIFRLAWSWEATASILWIRYWWCARRRLSHEKRERRLFLHFCTFDTKMNVERQGFMVYILWFMTKSKEFLICNWQQMGNLLFCCCKEKTFYKNFLVKRFCEQGKENTTLYINLKEVM